MSPTDRYITEQDWRDYEWSEAMVFGNKEPVFIRGKRRVLPPNDGYYYVRVDNWNDDRYIWARAIEHIAE